MRLQKRDQHILKASELITHLQNETSGLNVSLKALLAFMSWFAPWLHSLILCLDVFGSFVMIIVSSYCY